MAYIQPNKMLPRTSRIIKPYQCSMIATEGPNIIGKLNLSGVEIPYDSQYTTRIVLNPGATKQPLLYGFLGTYVSFMLLKFTYDETNPLCQIEEEQYVTYYFEDQPSIKRHAGKLLLLTGNSTHRIPQIFLENPSPVKVVVEALVANLEQPDINLDDVNFVTIGNLYYNSILSDTCMYPSHLVNGSSQIQIMGIDGYVQLYLDYIDILSIEPRDNTRELRITTVSDTVIILGFLSVFDMYQAHSRISWVIKSPETRYLTKDHPGPDVTPPVFVMNPLVTPVNNETHIYSYPYTTGDVVLPEDIINYFIDSVYDERDGIMSKDNITITLRKTGQIEPITGITSVGIYSVLMTISDVANNLASLSIIVIADDTPPIITFKPLAQGSGFTMTTVDMQIPTLGITSDDIIRKSVDNVYDAVDGIIPNSNIDIYLGFPLTGNTLLTIITTPGQYNLIYHISDKAGNSRTYEKVLTYEGYKIIENGEIFELPLGTLFMEFKLVGGIGTTATVVIDGQSFVVASSGTTLEQFVWDVGGPGEYNFGSVPNGAIQVLVNDILYEISFVGLGSLIFTIQNKGEFLPIFNVSEDEIIYESDENISKTFEITTNLNWTINFDYDWISFDKISGIGNDIIEGTTLSKNTTGEMRIGIIDIIGSRYGIEEEHQLVILQQSIPSISEGEIYNFIESVELVYMGSVDSTATVVINGDDFIISKNIDGDFVWDLGGDEEYVFTTEGESTIFTLNTQTYTIIFNMKENGNILFSININ